MARIKGVALPTLHSDVSQGRGKGSKGLGKSKTWKRHRYVSACCFALASKALTNVNSKVLRDNIQGVTKGDIRRLARRGGVKRIAHNIYDEVRESLRDYLKQVRFEFRFRSERYTD